MKQNAKKVNSWANCWEICEFVSTGVMARHWKGVGTNFNETQNKGFKKFWWLAQQNPNFRSSKSIFHICVYDEFGGLKRFLATSFESFGLKIHIDDYKGDGHKLLLTDAKGAESLVKRQ